MPAPIADVLAACQAAYEKMTPGPFRAWGPFPNAGIYAPNPDDSSGDAPIHIARGILPCRKTTEEDHDIAGIVTLVNHYPRLREAAAALTPEMIAHAVNRARLWQAVEDNERLRAELERLRELLNEDSTRLRDHAPEWLRRLEEVADGKLDQWDPKYGLGAVSHILRSFHERDTELKQENRRLRAALGGNNG